MPQIHARAGLALALAVVVAAPVRSVWAEQDSLRVAGIRSGINTGLVQMVSRARLHPGKRIYTAGGRWEALCGNFGLYVKQRRPGKTVIERVFSFSPAGHLTGLKETIALSPKFVVVGGSAAPRAVQRTKERYYQDGSLEGRLAAIGWRLGDGVLVTARDFESDLLDLVRSGSGSIWGSRWDKALEMARKAREHGVTITHVEQEHWWGGLRLFDTIARPGVHPNEILAERDQLLRRAARRIETPKTQRQILVATRKADKLKRERQARQTELRVASIRDRRGSFTLRDPAQWREFCRSLGKRPEAIEDLSSSLPGLVQRWAKLMEHQLAGLSTEEVGPMLARSARKLAREADIYGQLTIRWYDVAVQALVSTWKYGEALRRAHNWQTSPHGGERANHAGNLLRASSLGVE